MKKYLLDTNISIFFLKGKYNLNKKIEQVGKQNCFISDITVAELKYGVENSEAPEKLWHKVESFLNFFTIIPGYNSFDIYVKENAKLRKKGKLIDDFDLLIGSTSTLDELDKLWK